MNESGLMLHIIGDIVAIGFAAYTGYWLLRFIWIIIYTEIEEERKMQEHVRNFPVLVAPPPPPELHPAPHVHAHHIDLPH